MTTNQIDANRLEGLDVGEECLQSQDSKCSHVVNIKYKDESEPKTLGTLDGRDVFLLLSGLINAQVLGDDASLKAVHWDHFLVQKEGILMDTLKEGDVMKVISLLEHNDIPLESPSKYLEFAISTGRANIVNEFRKRGFQTNTKECYKLSIETSNVDMVNLVIHDLAHVNKVANDILDSLRKSKGTEKDWNELFVFLVRNYTQVNGIRPETIKKLCSHDSYEKLLDEVEKNTSPIPKELKKEIITPAPKHPFTTFWINGENGEPKVYACSSDQGELLNPMLTIRFCDEVLGKDKSNITLN